MKTAAALPTEKEISPTAGLDLDEQCALEHFYGLDQSAALRMFRDDADVLHVYLADFVHMGDTAFDYYLPALAQYLEGLSDERFVEEAPDAANYVLIRFSDIRNLPTPLEKLIELIHNRLRDIPTELIPRLHSRLAKALASYRQAEQADATNRPPSEESKPS